ncbi:MAG: type II toxin-antitoxin system HicB family antitoxin [Clostridiales Family XIII bacterium]|jgi:predicted RNase H-like HicB family nuclease|nr:type II toxin-antitoxin system HicB family antitoxin [Clostridiales Family XIII bacterium]
MKTIYPVIITETKDPKFTYLVYVPDFDVLTQGENLEDAIFMAEDVISLVGVDYQDDGKELPVPSKPKDIDIEAVSPWHDEDIVSNPDDIVSEVIVFVSVDFDEYRKMLDNRSVRRNVSLPAWLNRAAETAGVNVSAILQSALKAHLNLIE